MLDRHIERLASRRGKLSEQIQALGTDDPRLPEMRYRVDRLYVAEQAWGEGLRAYREILDVTGFGDAAAEVDRFREFSWGGKPGYKTAADERIRAFDEAQIVFNALVVANDLLDLDLRWREVQ